MCKRKVSQAFYEQFLSPSCPPIGAVQSLMELVHSYTGMPWWASLAVTTAALRTALTFPLMVYSISNTTKLVRLQPEIKSLSKQLSTEVALARVKYEWDDNTTQHHFRQNVCTSLIDAVVLITSYQQFCDSLLDVRMIRWMYDAIVH